MADPNSVLSKLDRRFPIVAVTLFGIAMVGSTLFENDKRGLLRWERPSAFASAKVSDLPGPGAYEIAYLGLPDRRSRSRISRPGAPRGPASRTIPLNADTPTSPGAGFAGPPSSLATSPDQQLGASSPFTPPSVDPAGGGGLTFTPGNLVGGETPFGLVAFVPDNGVTPTDPTDPIGPVNPTDPVVPAVPEPSAWLLMILGIGGLAAALRAQGHRGSIVPRKATI